MPKLSRRQALLDDHVARLRQCRLCPRMIPPPVSGGPILSRVMLVGQAPGVREPIRGRPFAWTAGKTLFRWLEESCGLNEEAIRSLAYFAAVCRCFPGKAPGGSDRVPAPDEIDNCSTWMKGEFEILRPRLVIPIGKLAIAQFIPCDKLDRVIGREFSVQRGGRSVDLIPLPHPSGASPWPRVSPGRELTARALRKIARHPEMMALTKNIAPQPIVSSRIDLSPSSRDMNGVSQRIRVLVWGENVHERENPLVQKVYPEGMHRVIAEGVGEKGEFEVRTATLHDPDHGLTESALAETDVLLWWGHAAHGRVDDEAVQRVVARVWQGMGFIALHSSHYSKPFMRLMGTSCSLTWREAGERERLWVCNPAHPIARGIDRYFEIENTEMYGEPFAIPAPDEMVFISWFEGGDVFRSGCTWKRGNGRIFYFRPGHETYPIYHHPMVRLVLRNAIKWAAPDSERWIDNCPQVPADRAPERLTVKGPRLHREGEAGFR